MSESGSLGTSSTGSDATTDPFSQLLASMARPIPCVTGSDSGTESGFAI
uniref:Bm8695 n=1 Tax=Brugia malayi TaxID=6279 RepID=A0A0J9XMW7_BRUMA|nr:Bm8695 [Brugia malayi]